MSRNRKGRVVNGIILLDKATGISSNKALQQVKHLFNAQKAGHTGSLDPLASGMLPICLGEATKFSHYLLESNKQYQVVARLGIRTNTGDAEGEVIKTSPVKSLTQAEFENLLEKFRGEQKQIPSMFSALKHQGQPLYKLARQGIEIERQARSITIYNLQLLNLTQASFELIVDCSKGTYIRNLIDDIGETLGCGAHVIVLRRLKVHDYPIKQMVTYQQLLEAHSSGESEIDKFLLPIDTAISHLPLLEIADELASHIRRGQSISVSHSLANGLARLVTNSKQFIGIVELQDNGKVAPKRLVNF